MLIFLVIGLVFEVVLHYVSYPGKSTLYYIHHDAFGTWRKPGQVAEKVSECFKVDKILVNSYGMRGAEPDDAKKIKAGFFGDSMTEGIQVTEEDHFVTRLNVASDSVDYLNFATSSTTTVYHLLNLVYHHEIFHLKKAVIFFFPANDIQENSIDLQVKLNGKRYYYPSYKPDGKGGYVLDDDYRPAGWKYELRDFLRRSLVFQKLYTIQVALQQARLASADAAAAQNAEPPKKLPLGFQVYNRETTPEWKQAFEITDYTILQIKKFCEENGIELEFVLVPSVGDIMSEKEMKDHYGDLYPLVDRDKPYRYYKAFLGENDIPVIDLFRIARERIAVRNIEYPYFSYECDGHFSKAGHDLIFETLKENGY